ncbi:DUF1129 family protein [Alkalicoccobacillus porphyridii]|uniref:DUF1129 family protein n=1 Tax=Alkalicoccobacillus porphyridii TaxID=2597270 RepID=A0A553ZW55_9BACI|nr:DUF1129 family protein [Alkalicoccobacillus porphyridii]TSB45663.1 DUF1129 family protein [Alkalicoccobacillus porphyridii]
MVNTVYSTTLSKESQTFLENLRLYLFSSGKQSDEIESIIDELTDHLHEAEKAGKPISKVVGHSPREYMESLSNEMKIDVKTWMKYIVVILFGAFSFQIMLDLVSGYMAYSLYKIVSDIAITLVWLILLSVVFKYIAANKLSKKKEIAILALVSAFPVLLYVIVLFTDPYITSPVIEIDTIGMITLGILTSFFIIAISLWAKTWILVIVMAFLILPEYLLSTTGLEESTQLMVGASITYGGILLYMLLSIWMAGKHASE